MTYLDGFFNYIKSLVGKIYPFYGIAIFLIAIFLLLFYLLSTKKALKIFSIIISFTAIIAAISVSIISFFKNGPFSSYLFNFDIFELVITCFILFLALNILIFISFKNFYRKNFNKIVLFFLTTVISFIFFIASANLAMIFSSLVLVIINIFILITSLNDRFSLGSFVKTYDEHIVKNYILRFFLVSLVSMALIFVGFSYIFGATDLKSFVQILETEKILNPIVKVGLVIIFSAIYLFLFIFPFQSAYIRLIKRCDSTSLTIIWFFYLTCGLFLLLKLRFVFFYFAKGNLYISTALLLIGVICILGGNIGSIKTFSVRRTLSFIYFTVLGLLILAMFYFSSGILNEKSLLKIFISNLVFVAMLYFPFFLIAAKLEEHFQDKIFDNLASLKYLKNNKNLKYFSITLIILIILFPFLVFANGYLTEKGQFFILANLVNSKSLSQRISNLFDIIKDLNKNNLNISFELFKQYYLILIYVATLFFIIGILFLFINIIRVVIIVIKRDNSFIDDKIISVKNININLNQNLDSKIENNKLSNKFENNKKNYNFSNLELRLPKFYYIYITVSVIFFVLLLINIILGFFNLSLLPSNLQLLLR